MFSFEGNLIGPSPGTSPLEKNTDVRFWLQRRKPLRDSSPSLTIHTGRFGTLFLQGRGQDFSIGSY